MKASAGAAPNLCRPELAYLQHAVIEGATTWSASPNPEELELRLMAIFERVARDLAQPGLADLQVVSLNPAPFEHAMAAALAGLPSLTDGARKAIAGAPTLDLALTYMVQDRDWKRRLRASADSDLTLRFINRLLADLGPEPRVAAARAARMAMLQRLDLPALRAEVGKILCRSDNAEEIRDALRCLQDRDDHRGIWDLYGLICRDSPVARGGQRSFAYILYAYARSMLEFNAAETAYGCLQRLSSDAGLLDSLLAADKSRSLRFLVRACARSGRADEAIAACRAALVDSPDSWDLHFQLATTLPQGRHEERRFHVDRMMERADDLPARALMVAAEFRLEDGQPELALALARRARTLKPGEAELLLAEANVHLRKNALPQWAASTRHFFEAHDLAITVDASSDHRHLFERLGSVAPPGEADSSGPLVVVVMTTFNAEQSVEYAVRSVLAQTYRNFRLVVVDDRSTDRTWEILSRLSSEDDRVILRRSDANRGTYCAKNSALAEFEAPFYTFHDSDDWMMPQRLAEHVAFMERNQQVVCSLSQWYRALPDGFALIRRHGGYLHDNPASTFLRQSAVHRVGFFDSVRSGADSEYVARLRRAFGWHSVKTIGKPLSIGLQRSDSLTASGATAFDENRFSAVRLQYWEAWIAWHRTLPEHETARLEYPLGSRPFPAPSQILP